MREKEEILAILSENTNIPVEMGEVMNFIEVMQAHLAGKTVQIKSKTLGEDWNDIDKVVNWRNFYWNNFDFRIKPEEELKATPDELEFMRSHAWIKFKSDGRIVYDIFKFAAPELKKKFKDNFLIFNPVTETWEDWSKK